MTRRFFGVSLAAMLAGCSGAGVTTTDLRGKIAPEIAQVVVNREQLAPWVFSDPVEAARLDGAIEVVRGRVAARHAAEFQVAELNDLRRFYSSRDGQAAVSLAYAAEGGRAKPPLSAAQYGRVAAAFDDPVIARSVSMMRDDLRGAFASEFAF